MTKTEQALSAFRNGSLKEAFRLMFRFKGFSPEEQRSIQIAYECMAGKASFYASLGISADEITGKAIDCVSKRYGVTPNLHQ